ncbi:MAG: hypothetical protein WCB12_07330 [Bryobacteraceae bacterium]
MFGTEPGPSHSRSYFALGAQIVSLYVTGCVVWTVLLSLEPLPITIGWVSGLSLLAWFCCSGMFAGVHFLFAEPITARTVRTLLRTAAAGVWFTPTAVLLAEYSPAAMVGGLVLVAGITRALYSEWTLAQGEPVRPPPAPNVDDLFQDYAGPAPALFRQLAPALTLALFIEAGTVAGMMRYPLLAAACFALSAALLTALGMAAGAVPQPKQRGLPVSAIASLLTVLLAAGLTVGTLTRGSMRSYHWPEDLSFRPNPGLLVTVRALLSQSLYDRGPRTLRKASGTRGPAAVGAPRYEPAGDIGRVGDNEFPGVILWPEVMPETTLVAPILSGTSFSVHATRPLGIPFSGEYWMFRAPNTRPPYGSLFRRGSPAWLAFSTTDHAPLEMEAHHRLDQPIDLRCCRTIQVAIWNADHYPGTVALELILIDTGRRGRPSQSLGTSPVRSSPGSLPVRETLEFSIPAAPELRRFDEFEILFHRDRNRIDKSAHIEIERFVLIPVNSL